MGDLAVTLASARLQRRRRAGVYAACLERHREWKSRNRGELLDIQRRRLQEIIEHAGTHSAYYGRRFDGVDTSDIRNLPIIEKRDLQERIDEIVIGEKKSLQPSFTGGTTGKSVTVYNDRASFQERFAVLDFFWEMHGFRLGRSRVAWFSGRSLLWKTDEANRRFWRTNWIHKVRYYSTFHMSAENLRDYVRDLNEFRPEFIHGFPSAITELARFILAEKLGLSFTPRAIFVTSEELNAEQRATIESVFGCKVRNHYCASEGAPFILECPAGNLHYDLTTGLIEVADGSSPGIDPGEMIVTCFFTRGTPLIRYRIEDRVTMAPDRRCSCGWDTPLVESIEGRRMDYIEVPGRGKIFNAQIGDCVKDVHSVRKFQVDLVDGTLHVYMVANHEQFEGADKATFLKKVAERMGDIPVEIHYVGDIPRAPSGKHSMVRRRATSHT